MSEAKGQDQKSRISLSRPSGRLELKKTVEGGMVRQSFPHGRSKPVAVEVKQRRAGTRAPAGRAGEGQPQAPEARAPQPPAETGGRQVRRPVVLKPLTEEEKAGRAKALADHRKAEIESRKRAEEEQRRRADEEARRRAEEEAAAVRKAEEEKRRKGEDEARRRAEEQAARMLAEEEKRRRAQEEAAIGAEAPDRAPAAAPAEPPPAETETRRPAAKPARPEPEEEARPNKTGRGRGKPGPRLGPARRDEGRGRGARIVLDGDAELVERRGPSLAAIRRQRERERQARLEAGDQPVQREVVLPDAITVQDLAGRMAVRGADVVKALMRMGVMASITQSIDAETAEIVVGEFGHKVKRVSEADVEIGLEAPEDREQDLRPRPPVVTVMGHVDHGKTSLLDAIRNADVAAGEHGGITQHIGAYQVDLGSGRPVTFIDTPGHAAFSAMRARGAEVTDIVVLVVAADDGVMPQTIEAIRHAQAAKVPIVVAINKIDLPDADPGKVKSELLSYDVVPEDFGGEVLCVEVSAVARQGLEELLEAINLQAEVLELRANPERGGRGTVVEAKLDRGRGVVATVLVQSGALRVGDIIVCGSQWGRVRALVDDRGDQVKEAGPSVPVEVLGLDGVPDAGDQMVTVESERRAREITEYRLRQRRGVQISQAGPRGSVEEMFSQLDGTEQKELPVVIKTDVHGSLEAIGAGLEKLGTEEVSVRVLHGGVGAITESDVTLALASKALVLGFNVRANAPAREMARRDGVEIRYYAIIYELLDDMKALLSGMLTPGSKETVLGHAEIREVFSITKAGKVAGCRVIDGVIRRGARARLLRDDVVIWDGALGSLKRFKDDVREVREGFECGLSLEGYGDIRQGDVVEVYEVEEVARSL